jgi:hypothetical protein
MAPKEKFLVFYNIDSEDDEPAGCADPTRVLTGSRLQENRPAGV